MKQAQKRYIFIKILSENNILGKENAITYKEFFQFDKTYASKNKKYKPIKARVRQNLQACGNKKVNRFPKPLKIVEKFKKDKKIYFYLNKNFEDILKQNNMNFYNKFFSNKSYVELDKAIRKIKDTKERRAFIKIRINQQYWANDLKKIHKRCAICGIEYRELLIAGHIVPYAKSEEKQYNYTNGIIFCVFHDKLFEIGDISFDKNKHLIYNNEKSYQECLKVIKEYDQELKITKQNQKFRFKHPDIKLPNTYDEWWEDIWNNIKEKNDLLDKKNKY